MSILYVMFHLNLIFIYSFFSHSRFLETKIWHCPSAEKTKIKRWIFVVASFNSENRGVTNEWVKGHMTQLVLQDPCIWLKRAVPSFRQFLGLPTYIKEFWTKSRKVSFLERQRHHKLLGTHYHPPLTSWTQRGLNAC